MTTDTTEHGLERLICTALTGLPCERARENTLTEIPPTHKQVNFDELGKTAIPYGGVGWICSSPSDYDREYCIDLEQLSTFLRTYGFLSQILPYASSDWEKLSIFLTFLVPKLPAPVEEDLSKGILEAIDMDSYRVEKQATVKLQLPDEDAEIEPTPPGEDGRPEPELDRLSNIIRNFNELFGGIEWSDEDRVRKLITEEIPISVAADTSYQNARLNSDRQNARIECDNALSHVITGLLRDDTELFKQFMDNDSFRHWLQESVFNLTYTEDEAA